MVQVKHIPVAGWMIEPSLRQLMLILTARGAEARYVGGCVRDTLLKKSFSDIDIATNLKPDAVIHRLKEKKIKVVPTGIEHGTVTAVIDGNPYQITTLRKDIDCDGRHAEVEYTDSWEEDAARRDFTINALSLDRHGVVYDYFTGFDDLKDHTLRFVGDPAQRITEDYLRILRLFRFHAWYGTGTILGTQLEICSEHSDGLETLSGERIQQEMLKLFAAPDPLNALELMERIGILQKLFRMLSTPLNLNALRMLLALETQQDYVKINPLLRVVTLFSAKQATGVEADALADYWKLSKAQLLFLQTLLSWDNAIPITTDKKSQKRAFRILQHEHFIPVVVLNWVNHRLKGNHEEADVFYKDLIERSQKWQVPILPIRGGDLLELGISEGKRVGELLRAAESHWEESDYKLRRSELLEWVKEQASATA